MTDKPKVIVVGMDNDPEGKEALTQLLEKHDVEVVELGEAAMLVAERASAFDASKLVREHLEYLAKHSRAGSMSFDVECDPLLDIKTLGPAPKDMESQMRIYNGLGMALPSMYDDLIERMNDPQAKADFEKEQRRIDNNEVVTKRKARKHAPPWKRRKR